MCGHVGVAGDLNAWTMKVFKDLLYFDAVRGMHGTGIATIPWGKTARTVDNITVIKSAEPSASFLKNSAVLSLLRSTSHSVVIGHNRHATQGSHVYHNTHPFITDNGVGAHNGTVQGHNLKNLESVDEDFTEFGTDSEALLNTVGRIGPKKTFANLRGGNVGAWALVWYDTNNNTINFCRNSERPLYYILSKNREQLVWASEAYMLKAAISRNDLSAFDLANVKSFAVGTTYTWAVPATGQIFQEKPDTEQTPEKKWKAPSRTPTKMNTGTGTTSSTGTTNFRTYSPPSRDRIVPPSTFNYLLQSYQMDDADIIALFSKGELECANCSSNISATDLSSGRAKSVDADTHICADCVSAAETTSKDKKYNRYSNA